MLPLCIPIILNYLFCIDPTGYPENEVIVYYVDSKYLPFSPIIYPFISNIFYYNYINYKVYKNILEPYAYFIP